MSEVERSSMLDAFGHPSESLAFVASLGVIQSWKRIREWRPTDAPKALRSIPGTFFGRRTTYRYLVPYQVPYQVLRWFRVEMMLLKGTRTSDPIPR